MSFALLSEWCRVCLYLILAYIISISYYASIFDSFQVFVQFTTLQVSANQWKLNYKLPHLHCLMSINCWNYVCKIKPILPILRFFWNFTKFHEKSLRTLPYSHILSCNAYFNVVSEKVQITDVVHHKFWRTWRCVKRVLWMPANNSNQN